MIRRPPRSTRTDTLFPYTTLFRSHTLDKVLHLSPDRIALYNYAHLPSRFKAQRLIKAEDLPSAEERLQIFLMSIRRLLEAGYVYIGLDHFAKPDDELNKARMDKRSEERRVGKERVSTGRFRWSPVQ